MKLSTLFMFVIVVLAICAGLCWYQMEGSELFEQIRRSENKPFFFK